MTVSHTNRGYENQEEKIMLTKIILSVCFYPVAIIMYYFIKKIGRFEKGTFHGATMKREWFDDPDNKPFLDGVSRDFKKGMNIYLAVSLILPLFFMLLSSFSIMMVLWMVWVIVIMIWPVFPQAKAFNKIREWKVDKGYGIEEKAAVKYVDLKSLSQKKLLSAKAIILPVLACIVTGISPLISKLMGRTTDPGCDIGYFVMLGAMLLVIVVYYFIANMIVSRRGSVICEDSNINANYSRAKRKVWSDFYYQSAWISVICLLPLAATYWFDQWANTILILDSVFYALIIMFCALNAMKYNSKVDDKYREYFEPDYIEGDDNNWIWGIIYYNPRDRKSFVETRLGMGLTANMAKPGARILTFVGIAAILGCLIMCIWLVRLEFSPMILQTEGNKLQAYHTKVVYDIDMDEIQEAVLITELPKMTKSSGNSMDTQKEGTFYIRDEQRKCQVFCNPQHKVFIRIVTDNNVYYLGGENESQTTMIYTQLVREKSN